MVHAPVETIGEIIDRCITDSKGFQFQVGICWDCICKDYNFFFYSLIALSVH